jgi:hypothetical protein
MSKTTIPTAGLADDAVTTAKITDANITTAKLADNAVVTGKITDGTIASGDIADDAVTQAKIADAVSFGKIGQVVSLTTQATDSISTRASQDSFTNTSVEIAITPSATSSKCMVFANMQVGGSNNSDGLPILALARDSTQICIGRNDQGSRIGTSTGRLTDMIGSGSILPIHLSHLDSPNTTSQVTYRVQMAVRGNATGQTARVNRSGDDTDNIENHRTASSITVMEVLA